jgi:hypothetical protein
MRKIPDTSTAAPLENSQAQGGAKGGGQPAINAAISAVFNALRQRVILSDMISGLSIHKINFEGLKSRCGLLCVRSKWQFVRAEERLLIKAQPGIGSAYWLSLNQRALGSSACTFDGQPPILTSSLHRQRRPASSDCGQRMDAAWCATA